MFIFVLQTIWLYISELAGKDLDIWIILKFLWYVSPRLIPLVLPLTILVTSLMVFGNFSENYEFAAMKSTGISLQRAMRSLTVFILLLSVTAFFFANNVIPYSEYKWQNLRRNISQFQPSMAIVEGQFSQVGDGFNIKVKEKSGDRDQFLDEVIIHEKKAQRPSGNYTVTIAASGELTSEEGSNTLSLILRDGFRYDEVLVKDAKKMKKKPFIKSYFEEYTINIDLTEINNKDIQKENNFSNHNMYNIGELFVEIDSLSSSYTRDIAVFSENMYFRTGATKFKDSTLTAKLDTVPISTILDIYGYRQQSEIVNLALSNVRGTMQSVEAKKTEFKIKTKRLNKHEIALHEKYALAMACIILFFVGAPLGAIIRKGGMGLPMVVAILLFLTYHFIGIFAKNSAEDGTMHPFIASWLSTAIMLPLSIWLTYRATTDQGIFDIDSFLQRFRKTPDLDADKVVFEDLSQKADISAEEATLLQSYDVHQLKRVVKNYRQYGYSPAYRVAALQLLDRQGISQENLNITGDLYNKNYTLAETLINKFRKNSIFSLLFFGLIWVLLVVTIFIEGHSTKFSFILYIVQIVFVIIYYIFALRAKNNVTKFSQLTQDNDIIDTIHLLGAPFFFVIYFYYRKKMKRDLSKII